MKLFGPAWRVSLVTLLLVTPFATPQDESGRGREAAEAVKPPNVLMIIGDQHRYFALESAGEPLLKTPSIDRIGTEGMHFQHAFSNTPVCSSCRMQWFTGHWPQRTNGYYLIKSTEETLPFLFRERGYYTSFSGKWHLGSAGGGLGYVLPEDRLWWHDFIGHNAQHVYFDAEFFFNNDPTPKVLLGYEPWHYTRFAMKQMQHAVKRDMPFFTVVSYGPPHGPYLPPTSFDQYAGNQITVRPNVSSFVSAAWAFKIAKHYGQIASIDFAVGALLDELEVLGVADNTVVLYTSDHGDMLGSHSSLATQGQKRDPREEAVRIPFMIRYPQGVAAHQRWDGLVNTLDVFPTLLGFAGIDVSDVPRYSGRNLAPFLRGEEPWPAGGTFDDVPGLLESSYIGIVETGPNQPFNKEWRGVVARFQASQGTEEWTYAISEKLPKGWLYNNTLDPYQLSNLFNDPAYAAKQAELFTLAKRHHDLLPEVGDRPGDRFSLFLP